MRAGGAGPGGGPERGKAEVCAGPGRLRRPWFVAMLRGAFAEAIIYGKSQKEGGE